VTASPFAIRGVIEGFYGRPWTHAQRLELIDFLGERGMNTFVYAPKDDPLVRQDWRRAYSGAELARLSELIARCASHDIDFVYCLSPGLSIEYSSESDRELLSDKFDSIASLGVTSFGLLLDDIPDRLQHPSDRAAFPGLVEAHARLAGAVHDRLAEKSTLFVCPTQYWGYGDEDYIARLGQSLDPSIELFWTGRAICSATLDLADAEVFAKATGRAPTYWDNYPVNDVAMKDELHVGPYRGRDRDLYRGARGVIANGMELFESSKIAFATIADYLLDPAGYEPEESWRRAIEEVAGEDAEAYAVFADNVRSSCLAAEDAPALQHALESFAFNSGYGVRVHAADELDEVADRMLVAAEALLRGPAGARQLVAESRPWIEAFELGAQSIKHLTGLYRSGRLDSDGPAELGPFLERLRDARVRVFGDVLDMALSELTARPEPGRDDHRPTTTQ
jgi:hyaluronoglucosaminidase